MYSAAARRHTAEKSSAWPFPVPQKKPPLRGNRLPYACAPPCHRPRPTCHSSARCVRVPRCRSAFPACRPPPACSRHRYGYAPQSHTAAAWCWQEGSARKRCQTAVPPPDRAAPEASAGLSGEFYVFSCVPNHIRFTPVCRIGSNITVAMKRFHCKNQDKLLFIYSITLI